MSFYETILEIDFYSFTMGQSTSFYETTLEIDLSLISNFEFFFKSIEGYFLTEIDSFYISYENSSNSFGLLGVYYDGGLRFIQTCKAHAATDL